MGFVVTCEDFVSIYVWIIDMSIFISNQMKRL